MVYQSALDYLYYLEISHILWLQKICEPIESTLTTFSQWTEPRLIYLYVIPFFMTFNVKLYIKCMIAGLTTNVTVTLMKWILAEARPYWWIQETQLFTDADRPELRQTEITCESSAGSPSGYVMFQTTFFFVILMEIINSVEKNNSNYYLFTVSRVFIKSAAWTFYIWLLILITLSRLYFACHFGHQCLFGTILGYTQSKYILQKSDLFQRICCAKKIDTLKIGVSVALLYIIVYLGQICMGIDPKWTIRIAFKWCQNPLYIKPETTPIYSLVRDLGLIFGLLLSAPLSRRFNVSLNLKYSVPLTSILIFGYTRLIEIIPRYNGVVAFYGCTFLVNFSFVFILLNTIPKYCVKKIKTNYASVGNLYDQRQQHHQQQQQQKVTLNESRLKFK